MAHEPIDAFAARRGKTTLYKFRPYESDEEKGRVRQILVEHHVYFSRASQLNDPFDLNPRVEAAESREKLRAAAIKVLNRQKANTAERAKVLAYVRTVDLAQQRDDAQGRVRARIENEYWVFSLAGNRTHPLLWSHYAAGHTGLCIHLRSDADSLFGAAQEVQYVPERPTLPSDLSFISQREAYERVALRKGRVWHYEEEFRWLRFPGETWDKVPIRFDGQHAYFPGSLLSGITLGARMPTPEVEQLLKAAAEHTPRLPVWLAVENDTFEFDFEQLA